MPTPREMALRLRQTAHVLPPNLWIQALTEAGEDPRSRGTCAATCATCTTSSPTEFVGRRLRAASPPIAIPTPRRGSFWAASCSSSVADRLGGLLGDEDFAAIAAQRIRWLSGAG